MKSNVTQLPTAATSYLALNKAGGLWHVALVTPFGAKFLKTVLFAYSEKAAALAAGKSAAARMQRPFKEGVQ